jgi:hypothetical protein
MDLSTILSLHLAGAAMFAGLLLAAAGLLFKHATTHYRLAAVGITGLTVWEIATGVTLSVMTSDGILSTCAKAGVYLALAAVANYLLLRPQTVAAEATS